MARPVHEIFVVAMVSRKVKTTSFYGKLPFNFFFF